jgi:Cytidylate kinase
MGGRTVVTIGREYGSGGRIIAKKVAEALDVPFYDKELIAMAANDTGLAESFIRSAEEQKVSGLLYNLYFSSQSLPLYDQLFIAQSKIIKKVAAEGGCVIVGRCADYVLHDFPGCLHIFIHAPIEERIRRAHEYGDAVEDMRTHVIKYDKARASYYNHFTMNKWGKAHNYDLTVNSALGLDLVADMIVGVAKRMEDK